MFGLSTLKSIMGILQSEDSPWQVAGGVMLGCFFGFLPVNTPQSTLLFLLIMFFNVNNGAALVSAALFAAVAALLDPLAHRIGYALLVGNDALTPLWTALSNLPLVPFTRFNNTVVLGSTVLALVLGLPVLFGSRWLLLYYRAHWRERVSKLGVMKMFQFTKVLDLVDKNK
jgi:uncharacterized protein (TIGR03546 family)